MTDDGTDLHALSRAELVKLVESMRLAAGPDITPPRNAPIDTFESTLATERAQLTDAQRLAHLGSYNYDVASGELTCSAEMLQIWGLAPGSDLATRFTRLIHPDDRTRVAAHWQTGLTAGGDQAIGYRIVRPDGATRHLQATTRVQLDATGDAVAVHGTHQDVTDLTAARHEAVHANTLLTAILAATPDFTYISDMTTDTVVYCSPGIAFLGLTAEQFRQLGTQPIAGLVHRDEQDAVRELDSGAQLLADGAVLHLRYRGRHLDGSWHWLDRRVTPFRRSPATGEVLEVLSVVRDVTDEHQAALALSASETRLRALASQVVDYAIIGLDADGLIEFWNAGAQRLKGYTAAQATGHSFSMFYTEPDRVAGLPAQLLERARTEGSVRHQGWRRRADGSRFWGDVVITALRDEHQMLTGYVNVTRDLTTQHRLEQAQASLFATVSHDLRNPITVIKMYAELLNEVDTDTRIQYAHRIEERAAHLGALVDGLFDYAKLRTGYVAMELESLSWAHVATSCAQNLGPVFNKHVVQVEDSDVRVRADRTSMTRIIDNLLSNAAKYSAAGSRITVTFDADQFLARMAVTDQGRGIAAEDLDTIFVEFNRGRLAEDDGGTGLGLASVRHLAALQGGRVWATSELGVGTTVHVELARAPAPVAGLGMGSATTGDVGDALPEVASSTRTLGR